MNARKKLTILLGILFLISFIVYTGFEAQKLIYGPRISVSEPKDEETFYQNGVIKVVGNAKNISFITLDDRQIFTDQNGNFNEDFVLHPGYNIITLTAKDRYGKEITKVLHLDLVQKESTSTPMLLIATSTPTLSVGATSTEKVSTTTKK